MSRPSGNAITSRKVFTWIDCQDWQQSVVSFIRAVR